MASNTTAKPVPLKLGKRPTSFTRTVVFDMLDGTPGMIECHYKYRTRTEFGQFIDDLVAAGQAAEEAEAQAALQASAPAATAPAKTTKRRKATPAAAAAPTTYASVGMANIMAGRSAKNAEYLLQVLVGWNLDVPLNRDTAQQLADEVPAAAQAIMDEYRAACTEGRLGN